MLITGVPLAFIGQVKVSQSRTLVQTSNLGMLYMSCIDLLLHTREYSFYTH